MKTLPTKTIMLSGSRAVAAAVKLCRPDVVAAYPITPQTHIVETLADWQSKGQADYQYLRAESESSAASMILGAAAAGAISYTATASQGLLHMLEVLYNAAGLELPLVLTLANRSLSAPINIWNDLSDAMALRDAGLFLLFAESNQEAIDQHIIAFRLAALLSQPVVVNLDGFLLTHTTEAVCLPTETAAHNFLKRDRPRNRLSTNLPRTIGHLVDAEHFQGQRQALHRKLLSALPTLDNLYKLYYKQIDTAGLSGYNSTNNGWLEYYGPIKAPTIMVTLGSVSGTIKEALDDYNNHSKQPVALLRLKVLRPWPAEALRQAVRHARQLLVLDRSLSIGGKPPLVTELAATLPQHRLISLVGGLGGKDINQATITDSFKLIKRASTEINFL